MGLFSGVRSLFGNVANLFRGSPAAPAAPALPSANQLFSGTPGLFGNQVPIAPGMTAPDFVIQTPQPLRGPDGQPIMPANVDTPFHVYTFNSLWNTTTKTYSWRWDDAYARCRADALAMRRDCFLMGLLFERKYPTAQMPWHIEPDDKKNPRQMAVADYLKACIETLPNVPEMNMQALEAIWYGRAGVQLTWSPKSVKGMPSYVPGSVTPVNGDKIQFNWDGTPQVRLYGGTARTDAEKDKIYRQLQSEFTVPREDTLFTDRGLMLVLKRPYWRDRFIIHKHDCIDADFYESEKAGGVQGVGIRHWIYWYDWIRKEMGSYILDFLERTGQGFTVYYYDPGNPQDKANVTSIAKQQGRNTWIVWPRAPGESGAQKGVERIEPNTSGAQILKDMLEYYDHYIERFVVGQTMSSGADNESGLGGSGRAAFARQTKSFIIRNDCLRLQGTYSTDLIKPLVRMNRANCERIYGAPLDFECRWKFSIDDDDPKAKLEVAKLMFDMGVTLIEDEVRGVGGFEKPAADDKIIGGQPAQPTREQVGTAAGGPATSGGAAVRPPAKPLFEGAMPADGSENPGADEKEEEDEKSIRYEWRQRAERFGVDPERLSDLAWEIHERMKAMTP